MNDDAALTAAFPALNALDDPVWRQVRESLEPVALPPGTRVFGEGDACTRYLLVSAGRVRVQKLAANGREILLYRIGAGESCVLTTSCLLGHDPYPADALTETAVTALILPEHAFEAGLAGSPGFRRFVFEGYGRRLADLIGLVQEVAFGRVDVRVARCLLAHGAQDPLVRVTHQALATELGTAREVISRRLEDFAGRGWVALERGRIRLLQVDALRRIAAGEADG